MCRVDWSWSVCALWYSWIIHSPMALKPSIDETTRPRFQVLALDGGGVRGIFAAAVLAGLEADTGRPVLDHFDLVVGTSTGGIIALGLGAGLSPREILDFYVEQKGRIFANPLGWRKLRHPFAAKYRPNGLQTALRRIFGATLLGESRIPLVVPSYDLGENAVHIFKTPHHPRLRRDHRVEMWAVGMATSAAPTYFPTFRLPGDDVRLIDGGVWCNNPAMVGVTEAVSMFDQPLESIRVLSIGTTARAQARSRRLDNAGLVRWAQGPSIVDVLLSGQSAGAFGQVQHLVGPYNAHRLNPIAPDELADMDRCDAPGLIAKAAHHSRLFCPTFEVAFGTHHPAPYSPYYGPLTKVGNHARN
jgi:patatin-like phospholipase/acyl hydrolase